MQYGNLSNQRSSAIVINADLLVSVKKKWLGLKYELTFVLSTRHLLEHWFSKGNLSIYVVCIGELAEYRNKIEELFDTFMTPYTFVEIIHFPHELTYLLEAEHIIGYFYKESTLVDTRSNLRKHHKVQNVSEISYLLNGGERYERQI